MKGKIKVVKNMQKKRNYKREYELNKLRYSEICAHLPRELGEQFRAQLKKDNIKIADFIKHAICEYLDNK